MSSRVDLMETRRSTPSSNSSRDMMSVLELHKHMSLHITAISKYTTAEETDTGLMDIGGRKDIIQQTLGGPTQTMLKSM